MMMKQMAVPDGCNNELIWILNELNALEWNDQYEWIALEFDLNVSVSVTMCKVKGKFTI